MVTATETVPDPSATAKHGHVTREISKADQREHLHVFAPEGYAIFTKVRPLIRDRQHVLMNNLTQSDIATRHSAFDKLEQPLESVNAGREE